MISTKLLAWYDKHGRLDLPWRSNITAYRTWISEIMLQQTQVATVLPYFERFLKQFPNCRQLALADLDEVLHLWTGLGYYARARNMHKTARIIHAEYNGKFPKTIEELIKLPGIGRSTAGAILAITYNQSVPILDGNVKRVLARYATITGWTGSASVQRELWLLAEHITPEQRASDYTQAIMDLGATICTRSKPNCVLCPIKSDCKAYKTDRIAEFPGKRPKKNLPTRQVKMLILRNSNGHILLEKRPPVGIWGGLWSFPECPNNEDIHQFCKQKHYLIKDAIEATSFKHTFSHFHLDITPVYASIESRTTMIKRSDNEIWYNTSKPIKIGLAQPVKKILLGRNNIL